MDSTMTSAVSGLLAQNAAISTVSNNLANSETSGYKATTTNFGDVLAATTSFDVAGSLSGVKASVRQNVSAQGTILSTTTSTDLAVNGKGLFTVTDGPTGTVKYYTRDGAFNSDNNGNLVLSGTNYYLQGWPTNSNGAITSANVQNVNIAAASTTSAATTTVTLAANLPAEVQTSLYSQSYTSSATGASQSVTYSYTPLGTGSSGNNTYLLSVTDSNPAATLSDDSGSTGIAGQPLLYNVVVNGSGAITSVTNAQTGAATSSSPALPVVTPSDAAGAVTAPASWSALSSSGSFSRSISVYDSLGTVQTLPITWTAEGDNQWLMTVSTPTNPAGTATTGSLVDSAGATVSSYSYQVNFNPDGTFSSVVGLPTTGTGTAPMAGTNQPALSATWSNGATPSSVINHKAIALNLGTSGSVTGLSQYASGGSTPAITVKSTTKDGVQFGNLTSVAIDSSGQVVANYSNGSSVPIYRIPVATFANENGLTALTRDVYQASATSGSVTLHSSGANGAGSIQGGALENSTTNTNTEFSNMIAAQQAYAASSQVIGTDKTDFTSLMQAFQ